MSRSTNRPDRALNKARKARRAAGRVFAPVFGVRATEPDADHGHERRYDKPWLVPLFAASIAAVALFLAAVNLA